MTRKLLFSLLPSNWLRRKPLLRSAIAVGSLLALIVVSFPLPLTKPSIAATNSAAPSAFSHVTDGAFTVFSNGTKEWSDVPAKFFAETNSHLYADQADLDPNLGTPQSPLDTFLLMYDECGRTTPLGPNEYFTVSLKTVEGDKGKEELENYVIHIFTDGTIMFFENGVLQPPGRATEVEGQRGAVGFGVSPNCSVPHVIAEFEIKLAAANPQVNGGYSPDPLFWSSFVPPPPPTPTPTPAPSPTPAQKTEQQRTALNDAADGIEATGIGIGLICVAITVPLAKLICAAEVAALKLSALKLRKLARDPADPNFTVIAQPIVHSLSIQPITPAPGVTQQEADALNPLLTNMEQVIAVSEALQTSNDRAQGAFAAGNAFWVTKQNQTAQQYALQLAKLLNEQVSLQANLRNATEAAGTHIEFTLDDVKNFQFGVSNNGLSPDISQFLTELGADSATQEDVRQSIISDDAAEIAELGDGKFPDLLTDSSVTNRLAAGALALTPPTGVVNPGFETGTLAGWDMAPGSVASVIPSLGPSGPFTPINPAAGQFMAFLSTAGIAPTPPGTEGSVITQTFILPPDATTLDFSYQFVSNDSSSFENFFLAELITDAGTFTVASADNAGGSPAGGSVVPPPPTISPGVTLTPASAPVFLSDVNILGSGLFIIPSSLMTNRVHSSFTLPPEIRGTAVTLRFTVGDVLDTGFDSAVVIDAITPAAPADSDGDGVPDVLDNCQIPNPGQEDSDLNGIGDLCQTPNLQHSTAAFLQALSNGNTIVEPTPVLVSEEPTLVEQIVRIVQFRIEAGLTDNPAELTANLVHSLVEAGLIPEDQEDEVAGVVLEQVIIPVIIDIKPGGFPNSISLGDKGNIPVAILSTPNFDVVGNIDQSSLTFGRTGDEQTFRKCSLADVNVDGRSDLVCHFDNRNTAFQAGDVQGILKGLTLEGIHIMGSDTIRIVPAH